MSFSISCFPSPKGTAPVRVECLVREIEIGGSRWSYDFKITLALEGYGWRGNAGEIEAIDEQTANSRVRLMIIEELGQWLADIVVGRQQ